MPSLRGLTVHVTDSQGNDLPEWGVHHLRQHIDGEKVSSYVESTTGTQFKISVQPRVPFTISDTPESEIETEIDEAVDAEKGKTKNIRPRRVFQDRTQPTLLRHSASEDVSLNRGQPSKDRDTKAPLSSSTPESREGGKHPDYSFLATLYLDGRSRPERKIIIYTNPADKDFRAPDGKVYFNNRWVHSRSGDITEHVWVFKEKAIESVFDRLMLDSSQAQLEVQDEDAIIEAMQSSGLDGQNDSGSEKSKVGQIVVEIRRIRLGLKKYDPNYRPKHEEGKDVDIDMDGVESGITHATGFSYANTLARSPLPTVEYLDYIPGEGLWATFQFFYRSADQLRIFGFGSPQSGLRTARTERTMNAHLASLTPLSIAHADASKSSKYQKGWNLLKKAVQSKGSDSEDDPPKTDFGSDYRDAPTDDELETEHMYKYPPAPLPFLVPRPLGLGPRKSVRVPGLSTLNPKNVSAVPTQVNLEQDQSTLLKNADGPVRSLPAPASTSYYLPHLDPRRPQIPYPNLGESSTTPPSNDPPSTTPTSKSPIANRGPSSPDVKKYNVVTLSAFSNHAYRPFSSAQKYYSDGDDEDADDELNTESDLETQAGDHDDDKIEDAVDPDTRKKEANDDEEDHEDLRARFQKVGIKKRTHSEVEDSIDDVFDDDTTAVEGAVFGEGSPGEVTMESSPHQGDKSKKHVRRDKRARTGSADKAGTTIEIIVEDLNGGRVDSGMDEIS